MKTARMEIKLEPQEKQWLRKLAELDEVTQGEYIRSIIRESWYTQGTRTQGNPQTVGGK